MPFDDGWIKAHRKLRNNPYLQEWDEKGLFLDLVMMAQRKDAEVFCKKAGRFGSALSLKRGQLWLSLRDLQTRRTKIGRIRTMLKNFEKGGLINTVTNTSITVITICNYDKYQSYEIDVDTLTNTESTQYQHSINTQNQERKERREDKDSSLRSDSCDRKLVNNAFKIWIDELGDVLPKPRNLEGDRRSKLVALLKKRLDNDLERWREYCQMVRSNPWNLGENDRGWRATIDYMLKDTKARQILENGFKGKSEGSVGHAKSSPCRGGHLFDAFPSLTDDEQAGGGDADSEIVVIDQTHARAGSSQEGDHRSLDGPPNEPPDWLDEESYQSADPQRRLVAGNRRI